MAFKISIASLKDTLESERTVIKSTLAEMKKEKVEDDALKELLIKLDTDITGFVSTVESDFGVGLKDYDMVKFLNKLLEIEYEGIFDYNYYASLVTVSDLADKLREFGAMEIQHAHMLTNKIKGLGAKAKLPTKDQRSTFKNALEMLKHHSKAEQEAIDLCDSGLKTFNDPELQWILGTIRVDELAHQKDIKGLIKQFEDIEMVFKLQSKYDPPKNVDFDSDEPWTEG